MEETADATGDGKKHEPESELIQAFSNSSNEHGRAKL